MKKKILLTICFIIIQSFFYLSPVKADSSTPSVFGVPDLSVSIPGMDKLEAVKCDAENTNCSIPWIAQYIGALQRYAIAIIGILAVIVLMMGGVIWLTAGGNQTRISEAKTLITGSLTGLVLVLASYLILYTINPDLTVLKNINISYIAKEDMTQILTAIKDGEDITQDQAELMNKLDTNKVISHTAGKSANSYKGLSCDKSIFDGGKSVEFFTTGYYKPGPWKDSWSFFCDVGLQCSCPPGVKQIGPNKSLCKHGYKYCDKFSSTTPYCTNNAAGHEPKIGEIAAANCFKVGDKVCLGGKLTLTVADRGSAIQGRRFDIWSGNDKKLALSNTGVVSVTLGPCK